MAPFACDSDLNTLVGLRHSRRLPKHATADAVKAVVDLNLNILTHDPHAAMARLNQILRKALLT